MVLKRASIFVSGDVQMAGFRSFVKRLADSLDIKGYAEYLPDGTVNIICEGEEESIAKLVNSIKTEAPALSRVEDIQIKWEEYIGEFLDFERRGEDVPKTATLNDLLNAMMSFDKKAEKIAVVLGEIKKDTAQIPRIAGNTEKILEHTSHIPAMRKDTSEIKVDTREIAAKLWEKYEEMSREIAQMKVTLARIEAKVFS